MVYAFIDMLRHKPKGERLIDLYTVKWYNDYIDNKLGAVGKRYMTLVTNGS